MTELSKMNAAVKAMNTAFGNREGDPRDFEPQLDAPHGEVHYDAAKWERLEKQCKNIKAEFVELMTAIEKRDTDAVRDALCDINVFSLGAHHMMGHNADADMLEVVAAVMTRFCVDEAHLQQTSTHYLALGVSHYFEGEFPQRCLKSMFDQGLTIDKDGGETWEYPRGKFLKALGYRTPVFAKPEISTDN